MWDTGNLVRCKLYPIMMPFNIQDTIINKLHSALSHTDQWDGLANLSGLATKNAHDSTSCWETMQRRSNMPRSTGRSKRSTTARTE